jgi:hypothetical protein
LRARLFLFQPRNVSGLPRLQAIRRNIPHARLAVMPDSAHNAQMKKADMFDLIANDISPAQPITPTEE